MFYGSIVALITPFKNGKIDFNSLEKIVDWHIAEGTHGLLPVGTTGESPMLSDEEQKDVIKCVVDKTSGRIPVIAGTSATTTEKTILFTQQAKECGADASLIVTPPYVKPTQNGLYVHYKAVHDNVDLPIIIYNNPSRAGVEMGNECLSKLSKLDNIIGVKDATSVLSRPTTVKGMVDDNFIQLSGEDATAAGFLAQGGVGCISVSANIAPKLCADMQNAWIKKDMETFSKIRDKLHSVHLVMFCETSPGPVKYASYLMGLCGEEVRAPLIPVTEETKITVKETLQKADLL